MSTVLEKPAYGSPCNSCGECCTWEPCPLGALVFKQRIGPCPALEEMGDKRVCGLIVAPQRYQPVRARIRGATVLSQAAATLIGSGVGCDAAARGEVKDPAAAQRFRAAGIGNEHEIRLAMTAWGIAPR